MVVRQPMRAATMAGPIHADMAVEFPRRLEGQVLAALQPWVESIAQAVTEEIDAHHGDQDGEAGEGDDPWRGEDEFAAVGEHGAPFRGGRLGTEAEKAEA